MSAARSEPPGTEIVIRWRDLDPYGHVNNAVYLTYLEEARDAWLARTLGAPDEVYNWVLARVAIDYRQELTRADGIVTARCTLERIGTSSVRTREEIVRADGVQAAAAEAVLVARDRDSGGSRPLTAAERAAFERSVPPPDAPPAG